MSAVRCDDSPLGPSLRVGELALLPLLHPIGSAGVITAGTAALYPIAIGRARRYHGDVAVDPQRSIHLRSSDDDCGLTLTIPLSALTPEMARASDHALLDAAEPGIRRLGEAPFERSGWLLQSGPISRFDLGDDGLLQPGWQMFLGGFITRAWGLGIVADVARGADGSDRFWYGSTNLEARWFPFDWVGAYTGVGLASRTADYELGGAVRGGVLLDVPLTSTIALQPHGGVTSLIGMDAARSRLELGVALGVHRL